MPVPVALRLYLPKEWAHDPERRRCAKVPEVVVFRTRWQIALAEIERIMRSGIEFGEVLADAGYGACAAFPMRAARSDGAGARADRNVWVMAAESC